MPTPVGPLGPDEIDPNDPDLWIWDVDDDAPRRGHPMWIRATALIIAIAFALAFMWRLIF